MTTQSMPQPTKEPPVPFQWQREPAAETLIEELIAACIASNPTIAAFEQQLMAETSTTLLDWVDHLSVQSTPQLLHQLHRAGFCIVGAKAKYCVYQQPGAKLPPILVHDQGSGCLGVALLVESISDFLLMVHKNAPIEGSPWARYRRARISIEDGTCFWVVERRGCDLFEPVEEPKGYLQRYFRAMEAWKTRPRGHADEAAAMQSALDAAEEMVNLVGKDLAAHLVAVCERDYWQSRNRAAQLQKQRQDRLGMGWANHDHHTFRASRRFFPALVRLFEILGFHCRERFYAGKEAGWGAQVMENSVARLVLFLDVDLSEEEVQVDFAHEPLPERAHLGTIGLWCALHGDSILQAGMHHLEAQFSFEEMGRAMRDSGIGMMEPFSFFSYLKQAFTKGEMWLVDPKRIARLEEERKITKEQAETFRSKGALGSHLENLQRKEGYKGFNQKNVSIIIKRTDPRLEGTSEGPDPHLEGA